MIDTRKAIRTLVLLLSIGLASGLNPAMAQGMEPFETPPRIITAPGMPGECHALIWQNHVQWDSLWHEQYTYHPNGSLSATQHDDFGGTQGFLPTSLFSFTYDGDGKVTSETVKRWVTGAYVNQSLEQWFYDHAGRDSLYHLFQWTNTPFGWAWDTLVGSRWSYSTAGDWEVVDQYSWTSGTSGGVWNLQARTSSHWNQVQEHDTVVFYSAFTGSLSPLFRYIDIVWEDFAADRASSYREQNYGFPWRDSKLWTNVYNGFDRTTYTQEYNSGWDSSRIEYWTYDADSLLLLHEQYQPTGIDSAWAIAIGERQTHIKDSMGHLKQTLLEEYNLLAGYTNAMKYVYADFITARAEPNISLQNLAVYPNPANSEVNLKVDGAVSGALEFRLYDMNGRLRLASRAMVSPAELSFSLDPGMESGMYRYVVNTKSGTTSGNLMITR